MRTCRACERRIELTGNGYWVDAETGLPYCRKLKSNDEVPLLHFPTKAA